MMTVRFPNGQAIQYNAANHVVRYKFGYSDLFTRKDGQWIVQVPNSCVIESIKACAVYNPLTNNHSEQLAQLAEEIRLLKRKIIKK